MGAAAFGSGDTFVPSSTGLDVLPSLLWASVLTDRQGQGCVLDLDRPDFPDLPPGLRALSVHVLSVHELCVHGGSSSVLPVQRRLGEALGGTSVPILTERVTG